MRVFSTGSSAGAVFLAWTLLFSSTLTRTMAQQDEADEEVDVPECGLYLAVSSTSTGDEPKWGLFAGKSIAMRDRVGYGEVAIQTFHMLANQLTEADEEDDAENQLADVVDFFEQYIWVPHSSGGLFELADSGRVVTAIPGVGVLGGYNPRLTNADWNHSLAYHRPNWGEEAHKVHPGRGASSQYFEVSLSALETIPAGMEIFINYGENWEKDNEDDDAEENAQITKEDHVKIDQTIDKMIEFFDKHGDALDTQSKQEVYQFLVHDVMLAAAGTKKGKKIASMMPESPDGLAELKAQGGALKLMSPGSLRTLPWLAKHGRCMDNIKPGPSQIPYAGRGALATRTLAAGSIVAPIPLVQVVRGDIFNMYPLEVRKDDQNDDYFIRKSNSDPNGFQLLLNYVYGHPESKMVFFPAGAATGFINHSPTPNAKLVWSDHPNNHKHWFDLEPEMLMADGNEHMGLLMEVVALQDIAEGEEVTIDYGPEWAAAWEEHLKQWEAKVQDGTIGSEWPIRALDYNNQFKNKPFPLNAEEYPDNLMMKCFLVVKKPKDEPIIDAAGNKVRHWADMPTTMRSENLFDCKLTHVEQSSKSTLDGATSWSYTVHWQGAAGLTIVKKVPHKAIVFLDKPGTSDQHGKQAFRHYIGIPDEIFPQGPWRNAHPDEEDDDEEGEGDIYVDEE